MAIFNSKLLVYQRVNLTNDLSQQIDQGLFTIATLCGMISFNIRKMY